MKQFLICLLVFFCIAFSLVEKHNAKFNSKHLIVKKSEFFTQDSLIHLKKLSLVGDFDGDGKLDTIFQNNISKITNKPIDHIPDIPYDSLENYFNKIDSDIIITMKNQKCDTLHFGSGLGIYCLINIGDNNNDNKDEIALVVDNFTPTNIRPCEIYTLCDNRWKLLKSYSVHKFAFDYEGKNVINSNHIKGYLEYRKNKWYYIDYMDLWSAKTDKDTILKLLKIKKGC